MASFLGTTIKICWAYSKLQEKISTSETVKFLILAATDSNFNFTCATVLEAT
jgi:hypothetical protein